MARRNRLGLSESSEVDGLNGNDLTPKESSHPDSQRSQTLARWREAGEWWNGESPREVHRFIDVNGIRRETISELNAIGSSCAAKPYIEHRREDYILRERKIRDEKVSAACGAFPMGYYEKAARERRENPPPFHIKETRSEAYVPLHVLSGYAFGRSTILAEEIAILAAERGCPAVAIADPHSLVGAVEFVRACQRNGIKPLVGSSFELPEGGEIVLIARSKRGYVSLSQLITACHQEEPRNYPMATWTRLEKYADDLIVLTGGDSGPLNRYLLKNDTDGADTFLEHLIYVYGSTNVCIEIEHSFLPWQISIARHLLNLAERFHLLPVAGGSVTHPTPEHFPAQDILVCSQTLCTVEEIVGRKEARHILQPASARFPERGLNAERYFMHPKEIVERFRDYPHLVQNTHRIAHACDDNVLPSRTRLPQLFADDRHALKEITLANAHHAYGKLTPAIRRRLDIELTRICDLNYASHFLMAWDFCRWAEEQCIQLSGRGSVVDSAVAYCLGLSRIDAIRHKLHFDRFLPADGAKRPDIDIDFEAHRRDDIRNYITRKYGQDRVATVAAVGAFCTRGIVREIGKAMGLPDSAISYLAKRIHGSVPPDQIESAIDRKPELRASGISKERFRWVFRLSEKLMDLPRNIRCHSSGVVVSDQPLSETVPVMWSASPGEQEDNLRIIQWDKRSAKHYFDKFDILCLRGQDVLSGTERRVRQVDANFRAARVKIDDPDTYRAMRSGELIGIPQSASPAMRQAHVRLKTQDLTDASLVQAGIRPGVGGAVKINELIARRRGKAYSFSHPDLEKILGNTYGIIVFQEQVDQLLQTFCGCSSGEAEDIRDAIHKRRREDYGVMIRKQLLDRMTARGLTIPVSQEVFELISGFKGYGFAQGHALAFAEISVRSIYCQQNYPAEYFAALLSAQPAGYYGPCTIVNEARTRGVSILHPDVNHSDKDFSVENAVTDDPRVVIPNGAIRVGLSQIGGLSTSLIERIVATPHRWPQKVKVRQLVFAGNHESEVPTPNVPLLRFSSLFDFIGTVRPDQDELEALILSGAFDELHGNRRALMWSIPTAYEYARSMTSDPNHPKLPLEFVEPPIPDCPDYLEEERIVHERAMMGLDVQAHLMAVERERVRTRGGITTAKARRLPGGTKAIVVGNPIRLRFPPTPSGKRVVFFDLEDETGLLNVTAFDAVYQADGHTIVCSPYITIIGESQDRDGHIAFLAHKVFPYNPLLLRDRERNLPVTRSDFLCG